MHKSAYEDAAKFFAKYSASIFETSRVLEIGAYNVNGTIRDHVPLHCEYVGLDIVDGPGVTLVEPIPYRWSSLADNSFDVTISSQTLEHCRLPWELVKEAYRVLKPGGVCYWCAPHTINKHEYPIDCYRFYEDGMRGMMPWAGFATLECYESPTQDGVGDTTYIGMKPTSLTSTARS